MASILIRTVIIYIVLILIMRFTGKRQIGELQVSELITAFLLSNIASQPITNANVPLLYAVLPIAVILCLEVFCSFLTVKCTAAKKLLEGKPSIVIRNGVPDQKEMAKIRMSVEDLICELRLKDAASPSVVDYAVFEQNGKLSMFQKQNPPSVTGIAHPVVIDGKFVDYAMREIKKDENWILGQLSSNGVKDIKDVFLMTVDDALAVTVIRKDGK